MSEGTASPEVQPSPARLPSGIWALGFVSLFMDISSEMIHGLLPVFLTAVLGASTEMVGLIEGIGEATASISKLFSGWVSDKLGKRKVLAVIGYGLGAVSKPLFAPRFSEAFLVLRAQSAGLSLALVPLVLVIMNIVYALSAYPLGALSDRIDRKLMLAIGFATLIAADTVLGVAPGLPAVLAGVALWGLHMGMTQGLLAALVADEAPVHLRATSFGVFNFVSGIALLLASLIAGALWEMVGPYATFMAGAAFTAIGLFGTALVLRR